MDLTAREVASRGVFLTYVSPKPAAVDSYAPAAAAAGSSDVALQQVLHVLQNVQSEQRSLRVELEKQQDKAVPTPTVPSSVTSIPLQEVGKAVEAMATHMRSAESGEYHLPDLPLLGECTTIMAYMLQAWCLLHWRAAHQVWGGACPQVLPHYDMLHGPALVCEGGQCELWSCMLCILSVVKGKGSVWHQNCGSEWPHTVPEWHACRGD